MQKNSYEVRGKKLGIIGYGNIGSQVSVLAESIGMKVYFYDTKSQLPMGNATPIGHLEDLLKVCDLITIHIPDSAKLEHLIDEKMFALDEAWGLSD